MCLNFRINSWFIFLYWRATSLSIKWLIKGCMDRVWFLAKGLHSFSFSLCSEWLVLLVCGITFASPQILVSSMLCVHMCTLLQLEKLPCIFTNGYFPSPPPSFFWGGGAWLTKQCGVGSSFVVGHCIPQMWTGRAVLQIMDPWKTYVLRT